MSRTATSERWKIEKCNTFSFLTYINLFSIIEMRKIDRFTFSFRSTFSSDRLENANQVRNLNSSNESFSDISLKFKYSVVTFSSDFDDLPIESYKSSRGDVDNYCTFKWNFYLYYKQCDISDRAMSRRFGEVRDDSYVDCHWIPHHNHHVLLLLLVLHLQSNSW